MKILQESSLSYLISLINNNLNLKLDKTGGEIDGNVNIEGNISFSNSSKDISEDKDSDIKYPTSKSVYDFVQNEFEVRTYGDEYSITPSNMSQNLSTQGKFLKQDVTVNPINYSEVSNPEDGKTVTIGG